jgi:hypothetical protein
MSDEDNKFKNGKVFLNALFIGLFTMVLFLALHWAIMKINERFSMSHIGLALTVFISAALFHIIAEPTKLNKYYCSSSLKWGQ